MSAAKRGKKPPNFGYRKEIPTYKTCRDCKVEKKIDRFVKDGEHYWPVCKDCRNEKNRLKWLKTGLEMNRKRAEIRKLRRTTDAHK